MTLATAPVTWRALETTAPLTEATWSGPERLGELVIGPDNASITFAARMFGMVTVRGRFEEFAGALRYDGGEGGDLTTASLDATIGAASIRTGIALRDHHLRGWGYLEADAHPAITFRSRAIVQRPPHLVVLGALTVRGVTTEGEMRCVSCEMPGERQPAEWRLLGEMAVRRSTFGVGRPSRRFRWLDLRPLVIGDDIRIRIEVRACVA